MAFVHLHVHSNYSLLDGAIPIESLPPAVAALGQPAVAVVDHCNLYGAVAFDKACKGAGIKPVFGAGLWVQPEGLTHREPNGLHSGYHLVLLVEDKTGYKNLCKLVTEAIFHGLHFKPRVDLGLLRRHKDGLIALTSGHRGPLRGLLSQGRDDEARARLNELGGIFGPEHLVVELSDVGLPGEVRANAGCRALAQELGLPTVVTNLVHYLRPQDAPVLDLLQCIGSGTSLHDERRVRPTTDQLYLKSEAEMRALFPEDGEALDRTVALAERCHFKFTYGTYYFPASTPPDGEGDTDPNFGYFYRAFPPPRDWGLPAPDQALPPRPAGAGTLAGYFDWYSRQGLAWRLRRVPEAQHAEYHARLEMELRCIQQMGFAAYFLIVAEFINWAKDQNIPVGPGRGSAAGSLVAWAQRITDIDPIRFDLLFERFLNPERVSMPDVDVDFCQDRREEVIQHTRDKYGYDYVAQIITYGKLQAKLAIRDVARVCDISFPDADRIAKLIPMELGITIEQALKEESLLRLRDGDARVRRILDLARSIEGLTRQTGVHAAGVVVADRPLVELCPLYRDGADGGPVVQYDMKSAEAIGLIKFDFLGLKTLDQLRDAVALIARNTGEQLDLSDIPTDDAASFKLLQDGDALGVFQVESSGMRDLLRRLRPSCLDDLVALVALYRPGPLNAGMVDDFIDRKHGRKSVAYPWPTLEAILRPTYGVVVYQEQVMQIAQVLSSYSLGEADLLRRAMGKKKPEEMARQKSRFVEGALRNGVPEAKAEEIFELLALFAAYGFNKSHSAAYGYVSYQTAWLKANHRAEFMAALMTIESDNTDKILLYINDCKRAGLTVLPPDLNLSLSGFDVPRDQRRSIRYGLAAIKGVGTTAVDAILEARKKAPGGRFRGYMDCLERLDYRRVNRKVLEQLIKAGAFDWTGSARAAMLAGLEGAMSSAQREQSDAQSGQVGLFGALGGGAPKPGYRLPDEPEWSIAKRLANEREAVGFYLSGHPIEAFKDNLKGVAIRLDTLNDQAGGATVAVVGLASAMRQIRTKRGDKMAFITLDDGLGTVECVFFADPWNEAARAFKDEAQAVLVRGTLEKGADGCKILAESAEPLAELIERRTREVHLHLDWSDLSRERLVQLRELLDRSPGRCTPHLHLVQPGRVQVSTALSRLQVQPDERLREGLAAIFRRNIPMRLQ